MRILALNVEYSLRIRLCVKYESGLTQAVSGLPKHGNQVGLVLRTKSEFDVMNISQSIFAHVGVCSTFAKSWGELWHRASKICIAFVL